MTKVKLLETILAEVEALPKLIIEFGGAYEPVPPTLVRSKVQGILKAHLEEERHLEEMSDALKERERIRDASVGGIPWKESLL